MKTTAALPTIYILPDLLSSRRLRLHGRTLWVRQD